MKGALPGTGALLLLLLGGCNSRASSAALPAAVLQRVRDVPLAGPAARFDYQDVDADARRLYVAHLGANRVDVVNLDTLEPVASVPGVAQVHGVRPREELAAFDAATGEVTARIRLSGCGGAHGVYVDAPTRRAFVACEDNARLAVVDLAHDRQTGIESVGGDPDVLAFDPGISRLYVAAETG